MSKLFLTFFFSLSVYLFISVKDSLFVFFSQDDFFHLRAVFMKNTGDIPAFFTGVSPEYGFFRPLSRETYNLLMFKTFGLNPLPFHIVNLLLIIINTYIIFLLMKKITSRAPAVLTSVLYVTNSVHAVELYYLGSVQQLLATTFLSLSVLFFLKHLRKKGLNYYLISLLSFLLAILSHEMAIVAPGILLLLYFFLISEKKTSFNGMFLRILPFTLLALFHFQFILDTSLPSQQAYIPSINLKTVVNNLAWYALWSFGLPESLVDFVGPGLKLNANFFRWFSDYSVIVFPAFSLMIFSLALGILVIKKNILIIKYTFLFLSLFVVSLSPFLFFPQHKFIYYLSFAILWFNAALSSVLFGFLKSTRILQILAVLIIFSYLLISFQTVNFYKTTYWAAKRANAAKVILNELIKAHPVVKQNTIFYIVDDPNYPDIGIEWGTSSKQAFYILSGSDALKLLYNDSSIETYYQAVGGLPKGIDEKKVISFTAKFPY